MREIKFRAFDKISKKVLEVAAIHFIEQRVALWYQVCNVRATTVRSFNAIELIQSTGLKDKNGREIYEGDIIRIYNDEIDEEDSWIGEISYHMSCFFSGDEDLLCNVDFRAKVIGNIYENPELLENASKR